MINALAITQTMTVFNNVAEQGQHSIPPAPVDNAGETCNTKYESACANTACYDERVGRLDLYNKTLLLLSL